MAGLAVDMRADAWSRLSNQAAKIHQSGTCMGSHERKAESCLGRGQLVLLVSSLWLDTLCKRWEYQEEEIDGEAKIRGAIEREAQVSTRDPLITQKWQHIRRHEHYNGSRNWYSMQLRYGGGDNVRCFACFVLPLHGFGLVFLSYTCWLVGLMS